MIAVAVIFMIATVIALVVILAPQIDDKIDEVLWGWVNRREYRRMTTSNPHLRPETLEQMSRRAWRERQHSDV